MKKDMHTYQKKFPYIIGAVFLVVCASATVWYFSLLRQPFQIGEIRGEVTNTTTEYRIVSIAQGLMVPWSIVFPGPERILFTERTGQMREVLQGVLIPEALHVFPEVDSRGEAGLLSLALHPRYAENKWLYVSLIYTDGTNSWLKVERFIDRDTALEGPVVIIDKIPATRFHGGSRIGFGPDGKLYITTGDATEKSAAQDIQSLLGKTLRLNDDGSIPDDNPFPGSPVWSYGHRNAQGLAWTVGGTFYQSEHGPSIFDGPAGGDEINRIIPGGNYGWPLVSHEQVREGTQAPLVVFTPAEAPASLLAYSGAAFPEWKGNLFFGALRGEGIVRVVLDAENPNSVIGYEKLGGIGAGRIRDIVESPDGTIYFTTSNRDGRATKEFPTENDDQLYRLEPK